MGLSRFDMTEAIHEEKNREEFEREMDEIMFMYANIESANKSNE